MLTVAWVSASPPDHNGGGGQIRQAHLLTGLAAQARIHLICAGSVTDPLVRAAVEAVVEVPAPADWRGEHAWLRRAADLAALVGSRHPIEVRGFAPARRALRPTLAKMLAALSPDLVLVEFAGLAPLLPKRRRVPWVLSYTNLPSRMAAQQAAIMPRRRQRWLLQRDARRALRFERRATDQFDAVVTCTAADAATLTGLDSTRGERVMVVPNGTDTDRLRPSPLPAGPRILFSGALYTNPNVDGALWLCYKILPLIREAEPAVEVAVVGARPAPAVLALGQLPGVTVHPDVPEMVPFFHAARVAVVPIRIGSGSRVKALEALAAGRPVVGTAIGLEGLDLQAGQEALVVDDPAAFAAAVVRVMHDDHLAAGLATAGRTAVEHRFAWPPIAARFTELVLAVAAPPARPVPADKPSTRPSAPDRSGPGTPIRPGSRPACPGDDG